MTRELEPGEKIYTVWASEKAPSYYPVWTTNWRWVAYCHAVFYQLLKLQVFVKDNRNDEVHSEP